MNSKKTLSPDILMANLVRQPTSGTCCSDFIVPAHPEYAEFVPTALKSLPAELALTLKLILLSARPFAKTVLPGHSGLS